LAIVVAANAIPGSRCSVNAFTVREHSPAIGESHTAAACGSLKSFLQRRAPSLMHANPTARQRVDRSSPFYKRTLTISAKSHIAAACGPFKSFLQHERSQANQKSHSAAACGWFRSFLQTRAQTVMHANPTARQRVDRSSLFYNTSVRKQIKNPTGRQRVDRSSPFYKHAHQASCTRIPQRGSV